MTTTPTLAHLLLAFTLSATSLHAAAAPPPQGRVFGPATPVLEADLGQRSEANRQSIELWLQPAAGAEDGAVIVDKLTPATGYGIRLEMGSNGRVRMIVNGARRIETAAALPTDRPSHLVAAFRTAASPACVRAAASRSISRGRRASWCRAGCVRYAASRWCCATAARARP